MKAEKTKRVNFVFESIRGRIESGQFPRGSRLPSTRDLAEILKVSKWSVERALTLLDEEGLVERRPRSGVYVRSGKEPEQVIAPAILAPRMSKADLVANEIIGEISSGDLRVGDYLPIRKAMRFKFRVSDMNLTKALSLVESRGLIARSGGHYVIGSGNRTGKSPKSIVRVLSAYSPSSGVPMLSPIRREIVLPLETELANNGIHMEAQAQKQAGKSRPILAGTTSRTAGVFRVAGTYWMETVIGNDRSRLESELRSLSVHGLPVVICDPGRLLQRFPAACFRRRRNLFLLALNGFKAARDLALFFAARGHKKAAFFSYSAQHWNRNRFEGVQAGFRKAWGKEGAVQSFTTDVKRAPYQGRFGREPEESRKTMDRFIAEQFYDYHCAYVDPLRELRNRFVPALSVDYHHKVLRPLFHRALQENEITAWICADPTVAMVAATFLAEKRVAVPEKISLASIDDDAKTLDHRITSHDLHVSRMGYLAAHCILGDIPIKRDSRGVVDCPGYIIDRGSVGRA